MSKRRAQAPGAAPDYRIYYRSTREPVNTLPMHVLAHAYRDAWRLRHATEPAGSHVVEALDLVIEFETRKPGKKS